jgi:putative ABC transport system substrate-binding protein
MTITVGRREFMVAIGGAVGWPIIAGAQVPSQKPRIGYLFSFKQEEGKQLWEACRQGLHELGYVEGSNIAIEVRWADGRYERLPALVAELIGLQVDIIVVAATPGSLAVKSATNTIPVVIVAVSDPTRIGLVPSLVRPGGNITGLSLLTPELSGKRLQLLVEIAPKTKRVTVLMNPSNRSHTIFLDETAAAGKQLHIRIQTVQARNPDEIDSAFQEIEKQASQALIVFDDPVIWSHRKQVVALADKVRLPVMYGYSEFVLEGGLISYGPNRPDLYRRTAGYVDLILKGAKPADLPIERPTRFELMINAKTANALDLEIPTAIQIQADRVIE